MKKTVITRIFLYLPDEAVDRYRIIRKFVVASVLTWAVIGHPVMSATADDTELPGVFKLSLGDVTVTTLAERQQTIGTNCFIGVTDTIMKRYASQGFIPNAINAFLVEAGGKKILVDTGLGLKLSENLASLDIAESDIDAVFITHMHRDHIGGLLRDGKAVFKNATLYIARSEFNFRETQGDGASKIADAYAGRFRLFRPEEFDSEDPKPLIRCITAYNAGGHTQGHTVFLVEGDKKKLLIWGDTTHATAMQVSHPEVAVTYDSDPIQAIETRRKILAFLDDRKISFLAGMHIAYPGIGCIWKSRSKETYYYSPVDFSYTDKVSGKEIAVRSDGYRTETERVRDGAAKGQVLRFKESGSSGDWRQITEHTYDADGWPVSVVKNLYLNDSEGPKESEESIFFPESKKIHYMKKTDRQGQVHYTVFNNRWQVAAYVSGEGKLIEEKIAGSEEYWEPLLKGESADEARERISSAEERKRLEEKAETAIAEKEVEASEPLILYTFPKSVQDALPADLDSALPPGLKDVIATVKKAHFSSMRNLSLFTNRLTPFFKDIQKTVVEVKVVDEKGEPVAGAQVRLKEIRLLSDARSIENALRTGRISDNWLPMECTQTAGINGVAVFTDIKCFSSYFLARFLFYKGNMPDATLCANVSADGFEDASCEFANIDKQTLVLAKYIVAVLAGAADDPDVKFEGDDGRAKQAYSSKNLAKTFFIPEENRHNAVQVKVVLKNKVVNE